ncbi:hypothetical protein QAD02_001578 [Eretmocerus hayati]|uniref:Uncharacterized protein n=1 Tax=Eretmocerus hayati TaxID=131215 RepID=A0ACC2NGS9_9HYME|nr:hypothetical protein QAD02_001578 [Eretmocerus hayati]
MKFQRFQHIIVAKSYVLGKHFSSILSTASNTEPDDDLPLVDFVEFGEAILAPVDPPQHLQSDSSPDQDGTAQSTLAFKMDDEEAQIFFSYFNDSDFLNQSDHDQIAGYSDQDSNEGR